MKPAADATTRLDDPDARHDARVGRTVLGQYEVVRVLGQGGMGTVYEARHTRLGRRVAVKFVRAGTVASAKLLARFEQEALSAGALESEHIPTVIDFAPDEDGTPCLVMEFLDGQNLAALLDAEGPLPVARAVGIVQQACRGLAVAHHAGVVHRDIKPSNLIVCRSSDGRDLVKIVDFGIAKVIKPRAENGGTTTGSAVGTPYYMSPEQARGERRIDTRADLYALGVILYELLTAQKPHPGDTYNAIIYHILSKAPVPIRELRAEVPEGLARIIHDAMDPDPEVRPASAERMERALAAYGPFGTQQLGAADDTVRSGAAAAIGLAPARAGWRPALLAFVAGSTLAGGLAWSLRPSPVVAGPEPAPPVAGRPEQLPVLEAPSSAAASQAPLTESAPPPSAAAPPRRRPPRPTATPAAAARAAPSASQRFDLQNPYQ
ncbi:MAG: serine/threonine protein kinase [Polyangiaceae bacterium]|nr:serine/threonine protein kinase [Polyangiaceae bacterium]MCL4752608.1 serine/threonine protein kinase [Myxococcales bacterium]